MGEGQTFLSEEVRTKTGDKRHMMIVVEEKDGEYLIVPVTTWHDNLSEGIQDDSCILNAGDHSFIKHKSWLDFRFAQAKPSIRNPAGTPQGLPHPQRGFTSRLARLHTGTDRDIRTIAIYVQILFRRCGESWAIYSWDTDYVDLRTELEALT